jgi:hypothetical protein
MNDLLIIIENHPDYDVIWNGRDENQFNRKFINNNNIWSTQMRSNIKSGLYTSIGTIFPPF